MISQTVEYALKAMSYLCTIGDSAVNCATISRATAVPQWYLAKIMRSLVDAHLVRSFRGPKGGFVLARAAESINLLDIVNAVETGRRVDTWSRARSQAGGRAELQRCLEDVAEHMEHRFRQITLDAMRTVDPPHGAELQQEHEDDHHD